MVSILDFNKDNNRFTFDGGRDFEYVNLEMLYKEYGKDKTYPIKALYINESLFGEQPLAVTDMFNVNLPTHLLEDVKKIREIEKLVEDINNGKVGFKIYSYENVKYKTTNYSINWVEING